MNMKGVIFKSCPRVPNFGYELEKPSTNMVSVGHWPNGGAGGSDWMDRMSEPAYIMGGQT